MARIKIKWLVCILALMFLFVTVGYAKITGTLKISGTANIEKRKDIFIKDANLISGDADEISFSGTALSSNVTLGADGSTTTLSVTIVNNSDTTKVFNEVKYIDDAYSNENIIFALNGLESGDAVPNEASGKDNSVTFTITFSYAGSDRTNRELLSVLLFEFADAAAWEPDDGDGGGGNSGGSGSGGDVIIEIGEDFLALIEAAISTEKNSYGLNDPNKGSAIEGAIETQKIVYSSNKITGGHIKHFASEELNTHNLDFLFEYSSDTQLVLYLWRLEDVESSDTVIGTTEILVYKQVYHKVNDAWEKSTTMAGRAVIKEMTNNESEDILAIVPSEWKVGAPNKNQ